MLEVRSDGASSEEQPSRTTLPMGGVGLQFVLKPVQRMVASLEYTQGVAGNHGIYLKLGYAW